MRNNVERDSTGVMIECSTQPTAAAGPIPTNHFIIIFTITFVIGLFKTI